MAELGPNWGNALTRPCLASACRRDTLATLKLVIFGAFADFLCGISSHGKLRFDGSTEKARKKNGFRVASQRVATCAVAADSHRRNTIDRRKTFLSRKGASAIVAPRVLEPTVTP